MAVLLKVEEEVGAGLVEEVNQVLEVGIILENLVDIMEGVVVDFIDQSN